MNPIEMHGVTYGYDKKPVLQGIDWRVEPGQIVGLLGKNGVRWLLALEKCAVLSRGA